MKKYFLPGFLFLFITLVDSTIACRNLQAQIITTFAGSGSTTFGGDGGAATAAGLYSPEGTVFDISGNMYLADCQNHRIRKVSTSGVISTIAGTGSSGFSGDGGPATAAKLSFPECITLDPGGNIIFSEYGNQRIRKISTSGVITTIAGNGSSVYTGDGGPATAASLNYPWGLAYDASGNLYIADGSNQRIRKVNTSGVITTFAGTGTIGFSGDGGPATAANLHDPRGIAIDATGSIYFTDALNLRVRKINSSGTITTIAGVSGGGFAGDGGPATAARFLALLGITIDRGGNIYVADQGNHRIRKINASGIVSTIAGSTRGFSGDGAPATAAELNTPTFLSVDTDGSVYVADVLNDRIRKIKTCSLPATGAIGGSRTVCAGTATTLTTTGTGGTWMCSATGTATVDSSGTVTGIAAGTAVISYSVTNGCGTAIDTQMVIVDTMPVAGTISGMATVCIGAATTLSTTGTGGAWSSSASGITTVSSTGIVTGIAGGSVVISYAVTNSCGNSIAIFPLTVIGIPDPGVIIGPTSVCETSTIVLTESVAGGTWTSSNSAVASVNSSGTVVGISAGSALISYTVANACGSAIVNYPLTVTPLSSCPTGVIDNNHEGSVIVFPNPNTGAFTISIPTGINEATIYIYDVFGKVVATRTAQNIGGQQEPFNLSNMPNGNYLVKIVATDAVYIAKVVVCR